MVHGPRPAALTPSALRTAELMETRTLFRKAFEESLGWYNSVKLEEGVYFQAPDDIVEEGSLYKRFQAILLDIVKAEPELAAEVKSGAKDLEALEEHQKVKEFLGSQAS
ncbi:8459_t:CDS:2 [Paraglomus brasilianum]|uniref:8459_t:CDS:1 n=1 Tax=Paraglomus brasilianum TaxID=144538 RepID=A0A9N9APJ5_9GLOM|nr:8459_t:CDS:2 [Paraglomus brasilianum]